jgi:hypothetical protein
MGHLGLARHFLDLHMFYIRRNVIHIRVGSSWMLHGSLGWLKGRSLGWSKGTALDQTWEIHACPPIGVSYKFPCGCWRATCIFYLWFVKKQVGNLKATKLETNYCDFFLEVREHTVWCVIISYYTSKGLTILVLAHVWKKCAMCIGLSYYHTIPLVRLILQIKYSEIRSLVA